MLEHEIIQSQFHQEPEQVEAFYMSAGVSGPSPVF